jgi:hypothetical protein
MAFADDYEWSTNNRVLVGTAGAADAKDDCYRIHGALPGGATLEYDLDVSGNNTETEVHSVAVTGGIVDAKVLVGQKASTTVKRTSDVTASTVSWRSSTKSPTGAANIQVAWSPTTGDAYAASTGDGSAFSRSIDGGVTWNGISLMDVSDPAALTITNVAPISADIIYMVMTDGTDNEGLFKTTDGGSSWERIWYQAGLAALVPSPDYATTETMYVTVAASTRVWKTANAGQTFTGLTAPKNVDAIGVVDASTYYVVTDDAECYKSGRWTAGNLKGDDGFTMRVAPDGTIYVGTVDGDVIKSTDDGKTFSRLGSAEELGDGKNIRVALDPDYATNQMVYAGSSDGAEGVHRWKDDGSYTVWKQMDDDTNTLICNGLAVSADGTLYAASGTKNSGVRRTLGPAGDPTKYNFQSMLYDFPTIGTTTADDTVLTGLWVSSGSNVLYGIANLDSTDDDAVGGSYQYEYRILAFTDPMTLSVALSGPKDKSVTPSSGKVTFTWKAVSSPRTAEYSLDVATDDKFANKTVDDQETTGTGYTVTGLSGGTKYYWRVKVDTVGTTDIDSRFSPTWTFTPALSAPEIKSPAYGADEVIKNPTFSWISVGGATSYELEVANNAFFANSSVKKPLTHTTWTWDEELEYGTTYYWRVRAVKSGKGILTNMSSWSEAVFTCNPKAAEAAAKVTPPAPEVTVTAPAPTPPQTITVPAPVVQIPPTPAPPPSAVTPGILLAIIIIGAVLLIAVIVLIVRTRRVP